MIEQKDIIEIGIPEENATKMMELLGEQASKLSTESRASARVNKAYGDMDMALLSTTKIPKLPDEMTTDYYKRVDGLRIEAEREAVRTELKSTVDDLNSQINILKESAKGKSDEGTKQLIKDLELERDGYKEKAGKVDDLLKAKEDELKGEMSTIKNDFDSYKKTTELKSSMPNKFKEDLGKDYIDFKMSKAIETANAKYDTIEKNAEGETVLKDSKLDHASIKASEFFAEALKDIIDGGVIQPGGGSGNGTPPAQKELIIDEKLSNGEKVHAINEYLAKNGTSKLDNDYDEKFKKHATQHGVLKEVKK